MTWYALCWNFLLQNLTLTTEATRSEVESEQLSRSDVNARKRSFYQQMLSSLRRWDSRPENFIWNGLLDRTHLIALVKPGCLKGRPRYDTVANRFTRINTANCDNQNRGLENVGCFRIRDKHSQPFRSPFPVNQVWRPDIGPPTTSDGMWWALAEWGRSRWADT